MPASMASRVAGSSAIVVKSERHLDTFKAGLKSFVNEARLLARFDHPALVKVYRFWEENGTAYMAMPFYEGPTLKTALAELGHAPSEAQLRAWLAPLLDALTVMHAAQCFHRDIAPDNILLTATGPLLLDFGAARRVIGDMTHALTVVLKPGYAPIEQYGDVASMTQGAWTDIYALACVVYYAITGKTPMSSVERLMDDRLRAARGRGEGPLRRRLPARDRRRAGGAAAGPAAERGAVPRPARHRPAGPAAVAAAERLRRPEPRAVPDDAGQRLLDRAGHADARSWRRRCRRARPSRRRSSRAGGRRRRHRPRAAASAMPAQRMPAPRAGAAASRGPARRRAAARRAAGGTGRRRRPGRVRRAGRWSSARRRCWSSPVWRSASTGRCSPATDEAAKPAAPAASAVAVAGLGRGAAGRRRRRAVPAPRRRRPRPPFAEPAPAPVASPPRAPSPRRQRRPRSKRRRRSRSSPRSRQPARGASPRSPHRRRRRAAPRAGTGRAADRVPPPPTDPSTTDPSTTYPPAYPPAKGAQVQ